MCHTQSRAARCAKRAGDIACALVGLIVALPLLALLSALVMVFLGRPALFAQWRPGLNGQLFRMYKFRTMTSARDAAGELLPDASRLTAFGRFLRATSLDELPELWNVLKGEMSLVGPRPLLVRYLPLYSAVQRRRHEVPPGITGWAQVNGRNAVSWDTRFEMDVWYVDNWSLWLDLKVLWLTLAQVVSRKGVSAEGHATMPGFRGVGQGESSQQAERPPTGGQPEESPANPALGQGGAVGSTAAADPASSILLITMGYPEGGQPNLYTDLADELARRGHAVHVVCPRERQLGLPTALEAYGDVRVLRVRTPRMQKCGPVEKVAGLLAVEPLMSRAIARCWPETRFGIILYTTPPITIERLVARMKRRHRAVTYLLLKDIFPQSAVDLGVTRHGSLGWRYFRAREKRLYAVSDHVGCMSPANVHYLLAHDPEVDAARVEVCPNTFTPTPQDTPWPGREAVRARYGIPQEAVTVVYGGNLGKAQGIGFLTDVLRANHDRSDLFFQVCGAGTSYAAVARYLKESGQTNAALMPMVPRREYAQLVRACDIGLLLLDPRFTIPNFPSRLLTYLDAGLPVLAATDTVTDVGSIIEAHGCGLGCVSGDLNRFQQLLDRLVADAPLRLAMGARGRDLLAREFSTAAAADTILAHLC